MFMIHSSELMPGGSPIFSTKEDIEWLYVALENIFSKINRLGYKGCMLKNYAEMKIKE